MPSNKKVTRAKLPWRKRLFIQQACSKQQSSVELDTVAFDVIYKNTHRSHGAPPTHRIPNRQHKTTPPYPRATTDYVAAADTAAEEERPTPTQTWSSTTEESRRVPAAAAAASTVPDPLSFSAAFADAAASTETSAVTLTAMSARDGSPSLAGEGRMDEPRMKRQEKESREYCWVVERKGTFRPSIRPKALSK